MRPLFRWLRRIFDSWGGQPPPWTPQPPQPSPQPLPPPWPQPQPQPQPPQAADLVMIRRQLLAFHNQTRARYNAGPLAENAQLDASAQAHANLMATMRQMSHQLPGEPNFFQREQQAGYRPMAGGENIAAGQNSPTAVFAAWQSDQPHLANIISTQYHDVGIGVAQSVDGHLYWCVDFGSQSPVRQGAVLDAYLAIVAAELPGGIDDRVLRSRPEGA